MVNLMMALAKNRYKNIGVGGMFQLGHFNRSIRVPTIIYQVCVEPWCMEHEEFNNSYRVKEYLAGGALGRVFYATELLKM